MLSVAAPASDLDGVVEAGIVVRQRAPASASRFPAMPRAMLTFVQGAAGVDFTAMSTRPASHVHGRPFQAVGLVLTPCAAARLMGPSTGALVDAVLPWEHLAGVSEANRVADALRAADGDAAQLRALQDSLRRVLSRGPERVQSGRSATLQRLCSAVSMQGAQAASSLGLGERQLERRCRALLGVSPKQLQRLARFHAVLSEALVGQRTPGAQAALVAGYYDQSHLAREASQLAGAPLRELLSASGLGGAWWPLRAQRLRVR